MYWNYVDILERPIRTYRVKYGGVDSLREVNKEQFHELLLSSVNAETDELRHKAKSQVKKPFDISNEKSN